MAIVWPCELSVDAYIEAGRDLDFPRPACPDCEAEMERWSGYCRSIREAGHCARMFVPRLRCEPCSTTHALLPAFCLTHRLDSVETIGAVIESVVVGPGGVRPAAEAAQVPHTTARGWVRRFQARAQEVAVSFSAVAVDLAGAVVRPVANAGRHGLLAITQAFDAAQDRPGWHLVARWRFVACVTGGRLLATNTDSPYRFIGRRSFMVPIART